MMMWWQIVLLILVLILIVLYFVLIPLAKKKSIVRQNEAIEKMHSQLKAGDKVVLLDGIVGTIVSLNDKEVDLKIAANTVVKVKTIAIAGVESNVGKENVGEMERVRTATSRTE